MNEKIYCKDCRFYEDGWCQRMPPTLVSWHKDALFPKVDIFDWCGMAEPKEKAKPGFPAVGKVEAGEAVYVIERDELEKMKEENHKLKEAKKGLLLQLKTVCANYGTDCYCRWYTKGGCKGMNSFTCTLFNTIKKYDREEGENV